MTDPKKFENLIDIDDLTVYNSAREAKDAQTYETKQDAAAKANVIESISVNGDAQTVSNAKNVDIDVPTKTSELTNDSNYAVDASYVHTDNNFTDTLKSKLEGLADDGEKNTIESVKVNGSALAVADEAVNLTVTEGATDGTVAVNGSDVAVHGLGSAAYAETSAFGDANVIEGITVGGTAQAPESKVVALGSAAGASTAAAVSNDSTLPTGAAVQSYVTGLGYQTADDVQTAISNAQAAAMTWKGVKENVSDLPETGNKAGDMWHVSANGSEYAWDGSAWQEMGVTFNPEGYAQDADFSIASQASVLAIVNGSQQGE